MLDLHAGYARGNGEWDPDTRTPTRLEDQPQVTLRLALLRDGTVMPYAADEDLGRAWALSEVGIAASRIAACPVPPEHAAAAEAARAQWGRWERESPRLLLAVMTAAGEGFTVPATTAKGDAVPVGYDCRSGLMAARVPKEGS